MRTFLFFVIAFFITGTAVAQTTPGGASPAVPLDFRTQTAPSGSSSSLSPYQFDMQGHEPVTFSNLFRLYWKSELVKPENREAIEEYLKTSECRIYQANFKNDFLWPDILKSTVAYIRGNRRNFVSSFTFVQPIFLDRYDPHKQWFIVTPETQYLNTTMMTFADYDFVRTDCDSDARIYPTTVPRRAIIRFQQPFSLTYLSMTPDFANQYIQYMASREKKVEIGGGARDRYAYVQFYFTVTGLDLEKTKGNIATFLGTLDGYVIYADQDLTMPLSEWSRPHQKSEMETPEEGRDNTEKAAPSVVLPAKP